MKTWLSRVAGATGAAFMATSAHPAPATSPAACINGSGEAAIASCTRLIESDKFGNSTTALFYVLRGDQLVLSKGEHDRAIADYDKAISLDPKLSLAYQSRAEAYRALGQVDAAIASYDQAIKLNAKQAHAYTGRGLAYWEKAELDRAVADYTRAIQLKSGAKLVYFHRGNAYRAKSEYRRAIADYDVALRRNPNLELARYSRGFAYLMVGSFDQAIADFTALLKSELQARPLFGRGVAKLKKGDVAGGNADLQAAKALEPDIAQEFASLGVSLP